MYSGILFTKLGAVMRSPVLKLQYSVMYIAIPIVCGLCILFLVIQLISLPRDIKEDNK